MLELPFRNRTLSWVLLCGLIGFNLVTLGRVPALPSADDGGYSAAAHQFFQTGRPGVPGYRDILGLSTDVYIFGRIAAAFQGWSMAIFGVSFWAALFPSFIAGLWLLGATYLLARTLWDKELALLAAIILASSGIFFLASHSARPDILLAFFWVMSLYLVAAPPPGRWSWKYPAAGLVMGLSGDVHLNGFLLAPIPLLFWLARRRENPRIRALMSLSYIGGVSIGVLFWLALHYWPNPEAFLRQTQLIGGKTHRLPILNAGLTGAFQGEIQRYLSWFWEARGHRHLLEGLIIFGSGACIAAWGDRKDRALVFAWLTCFGSAALLMANPFHWYLIYAWPLFALWVTRGLSALRQTIFPASARTIFVALLAANLLNLAFWTGKAYSGPSYTAISDQLRSMVPPRAAVIAGGEWWFALYDRDFTDAQYLDFRALEAAHSPGTFGITWETEWLRFRWQFAVAHGDLQALLDPEISWRAASAIFRRTRDAELPAARALVKNHGRVLKRLPTSSTPVLVIQFR